MFEDLVKEAAARAGMTRRSLSENDGSRGPGTALPIIAAKPIAEPMRTATGTSGLAPCLK